MFVPSAWAEQPSEIDTMHHLTSGSLSAQRGSILLLLQEDEENILQCVRGSVFSPSECSEYAVIWYRMPKITVMNYQYFFLFFKDFTSIVIHHLILLISSAVKCMQTVKALEYEQKALWAAVGVWGKKKQTAFFRNAIIPPPSVFAVTGMFRFYRLSVIMMTLLVFLPLHWLCACICVSCSVFCFSSPSTTANELINITSLKRISYFNIYF